MDKRLAINLSLIGFIILLSVLVFNTDNQSEQTLTRLSSIDQKTIHQIKILRKEVDDFEFEKQNDQWQLTKPQFFRANHARINAMLRMLNVESHSQLNPAEVNLKSLGLDNPVVIMNLNEHEFKFGNTDAIDQRRYVLYEDKIHLTNDFLYQQLMTNAAFFADPKILPAGFKIESITFPENKIEHVNGQWNTNPLLDISPEQLKRIIFSWETTAAISADAYKPAASVSTIKIESKDNESIHLDIVSTEPHLILGRKDIGIQFHMGSDEAKKLLLLEGINPDELKETTGLELH